MPCVFCAIRDGEVAAEVVYDRAETMAFLDARPVFPGHVLVIPKLHVETLPDLPHNLLVPLFASVQELSRAVPHAMGGDGSFVAANNVVSQSVPHLHVHVVPRKRKDGLRGFFWPRQKYDSEAAMAEVGDRIRASVGALATDAGSDPAGGSP